VRVKRKTKLLHEGVNGPTGRSDKQWATLPEGEEGEGLWGVIYVEEKHICPRF